jgi:hypothetical protein
MLPVTLFRNVNTNTFNGFIQLGQNAITILMGIVGAMAVIFLLYGAFQYVTSTGDPNRAANARKTIMYAVGGLVLALSTYAIVNYISSSFGI